MANTQESRQAILDALLKIQSVRKQGPGPELPPIIPKKPIEVEIDPKLKEPTPPPGKPQQEPPFEVKINDPKNLLNKNKQNPPTEPEEPREPREPKKPEEPGQPPMTPPGQPPMTPPGQPPEEPREPKKPGQPPEEPEEPNGPKQPPVTPPGQPPQGPKKPEEPGQPPEEPEEPEEPKNNPNDPKKNQDEDMDYINAWNEIIDTYGSRLNSMSEDDILELLNSLK